mgnify:CR=1 FL=1
MKIQVVYKELSLKQMKFCMRKSYRNKFKIKFEFIKDNDGTFPAVRQISEIAGAASILIASEIMSITNEGNGLMLGNISGVPPTEVVIIGAGIVGEYAAKSAIGLGANVRVFDNSITKLRTLQANIGRRVYTLSLIHI